MANIKVIVGLSGGVDSSVACKLLLDAGYIVEAALMKNWEEDDSEEVCSAEEDLNDAKEVAANLGIKLHTVNFAHEYWERVFKYFLAEYGAGRTPNPDVLCNSEIKFREFLSYCLNLGANKIATGHYAQVDQRHDGYYLLRGVDTNKDQSYFLHLLNQKQLAKTILPLGKLTKPVVREIAQKQGFSNADKKDSTGICFIGEKNFKKFLQDYLPAQKGEIRTPEGILLGEHEGLMYYTLGQRKGISIGGHKDFPDLPWYVLAKNMTHNTLVVGQDPKHPLLTSTKIEISKPHWINADPVLPFRCAAKNRYRQPDNSCTITGYGDNLAIIEFSSPQYAATPGQSLVLYDKNICLGGGIIGSTQ